MRSLFSSSMEIAKNLMRIRATPFTHSSQISTIPIKPFSFSRYVYNTQATQQPRSPNTIYTSTVLLHRKHYDEEGHSLIWLMENTFKAGAILKSNALAFDLPYHELSDVAQLWSLPKTPMVTPLLGSCKGWVCLAYYHKDLTYVINPVNGDYLKLPKAGECLYLANNFGFGFDEVADEYKLIRIFRESKCSFKSEAELYTLGLGQWRKFGDVPYPLRRRNHTQVFVSGAFHWMLDEVVGLGFSEFIVSFDVAREEFDLVPTPPNLIASWKNGTLYLRELGGRLCLVDYSSEDQCELRVMEDYRETSSWTKEYIIPDEFSSKRFWPIKVSEDGAGIMMHVKHADGGDSIAGYDQEKNTLLINESASPPGFSFEVVHHVKCFKPLKDIVGPTCGSVRRLKKLFDTNI